MSKKFGTFAGVFTPSILTILGVIMYLRLGWVVGEAGLYAAIGLILLAHIISISTGLSLSSIATDKKIKTGGIYYMLSRSLGLPIGGAIGITLFVGTAFSIALYIVGFVENFISIEAISTFLGMSGTVNDIRIIGSFVVLSLVILAYISTSIAIKTQFFILGAIGLSILSIIVGVFTQTDAQPIVQSIGIAAKSPDLIVIFAIFFPAVTGFTAGVAMSGDLKSPKSSIPFGTLAAIAVGLVVYIGLALLFGLYVDRDLLIQDSNFLVKIAWFSPLVIAGIWGATLSSALGGLLGAPRILQAMSLDKITPKIFGKGNGKNNEPRRALILTFILAELGILIGELDVIAAIVSMFYIAAYGFINLAYVLESWANSDFRPSLKIPNWIGIIGFLASMGVMFKIDTLAMGVSLIIIFGIYFLLKRKEIQGNTGNVWQSVWTSLIRSSLHKINQNPLLEKNWEPNIILFSGGSKKRTHLLDLGSSFVGDHGLLSNFDLSLKTDKDFLFSKKDQNINSDISSKYPGVFTRQQSVSSIYEGMEIIAQTYGFSGVEPNTVMMGWSNQNKKPTEFVQSINRLLSLDMNVLLVDFDLKRGFGKYKKIDIWWRGGSHNGNLALYLAKFLLNAEPWANAQIRLLIVNDQKALSASIYSTAHLILESLRIKADIIVIDNEIEQKTFFEIIETESLDTDLTFLGFPQLEVGKEKEFVEKANKLCQNIGSVVLIRSSSLFKQMHLMELISDEQLHPKFNLKETENIELQKIILPKNQKLSQTFGPIANQLQTICINCIKKESKAFGEFQNNILQHLLDSVEHSFHNLSIRLASPQTAQSFDKIVVAQHSLFIRAQNQYLNETSEKFVPKLTDEIRSLHVAFIEQIQATLASLPQHIKIVLSRAEIETFEPKDKYSKKAKSRLKPLWKLMPRFPYFVNFQSLFSAHFPHKAYLNAYASLVEYDQLNYKSGHAFLNTVQKISDIFETLKPINSNNTVPTNEELTKAKTKILSFINELGERLNQSLSSIEQNTFARQLKDLNTISDELSSLFPNAYENHQVDYFAQAKKLKKRLLDSHRLINENLSLIINKNSLNNALLQFNQQTRLYLNKEYEDLTLNIRSNYLKPIQLLTQSLDHLKDLNDTDPSRIHELLKTYVLNTEVSVSQQLLDIDDSLNKKIKAASHVFPEKIELYTEEQAQSTNPSQLNSLEGVQASISRTIEYLVEKEIYDDLRNFLFEFGPKIESIKTEFNKILREFDLYQIGSKREKMDLSWDDFLNIKSEALKTLETSLNDRMHELLVFFDTKNLHLKKVFNLYTFLNSLTSLKQYIRVQTHKNNFDRIKEEIRKLNIAIEKQLNKLWYNQSSGLILARRLSKAMLRKETRVDDLLKFKENVSASNSLLKKIPDYYKQIFLRKHFYLQEFWVGREAELESALRSIEHFNKGYKGGILVTGERNSGKSFFLHQLLRKAELDQKAYHISPPYLGSTSTQDLLSSFQFATEKSGSLHKILNSLPSGGVFVIDDLELWWEKSPNGIRVIEQLANLMEKFSNKHLFLFACDINTFQLINYYRKIESSFINLIELSPLNAQQIKDAIFKRHASTGMLFNYKDKEESRLRSWQTARLFSSYFNYSEGNIGVALQTWIANIQSVDENILTIKKPKTPNYSIFNYLETEWMIFIMQFMLHKRMDKNKLIRVSRDSRKNIEIKVNILLRAGILNQKAEGVLEINQFIAPYLQKALIKRQLF
jgi:amino acid transporter